MSILDDIITRDKTGSWPGGVPPDWARNAASKLDVAVNSVHVIEAGLRQIILAQQVAIHKIVEAMEPLVEDISKDRPLDKTKFRVLLEKCREAVDSV